MLMHGECFAAPKKVAEEGEGGKHLSLCMNVRPKPLFGKRIQVAIETRY